MQPEDSTAAEVELVGDLKAELETLSGAKLRATGIRSDDGGLSVLRYEILEIAGHVPVVGFLTVQDTEVILTTESGETHSIRDARKLLTLDGAKVWVILESEGAVTGYGVIRER